MTSAASTASKADRPIADCHTHTSFSDGAGTHLENVRAAAKAGCSVLVATDHMTLPDRLDPDCECSVPVERLAELARSLDEAQAAAAELGLELVRGWECDWYEGCEPNIECWRGDATFLLGSIHYIGELALDNPDDRRLWDELGADGVWEAYVERWVQACFSPAAFDSMAHPDLPRLLEAHGYPRTRSMDGAHARMAEAAREAGVHVEVSTAGLRKPKLGDFYPARTLLEQFCAAGVPLTLGSDAHRAQDVAFGFEDACRYAYEAGYRSYNVPRADGSWTTHQL